MNRRSARLPIALTLLAALCVAGPCRAADAINIWPDDSPELKSVDPKHIPRLTLHHGPASDKPKPAVLILPAGGYKHHSNMMSYVKWLNSLGIAAYVVNYRLPVHGYKHPAPLNDAQRCMRIIRANAAEWNLDPTRIGALGASSGGHLASTLATHYDRGDENATDPIDKQSCRPDFVFLNDAVITMQGKFCHTPSRVRLLPEDPPQALVDNLSNELQVTADCPPVFLRHGGQDKLVPAENSLHFFIALRQNNVAHSELHFYSHGGHFYQDCDWQPAAEAWLKRLGVIGELHMDEKQKKSLTDPGAWANDNT